LFWKIKHFENKGGAKLLCLGKELEVQVRAWSQEHKDLVGLQTYSSIHTLANKIFHKNLGKQIGNSILFT
jgi:hypothetical protein